MILRRGFLLDWACFFMCFIPNFRSKPWCFCRGSSHFGMIIRNTIFCSDDHSTMQCSHAMALGRFHVVEANSIQFNREAKGVALGVATTTSRNSPKKRFEYRKKVYAVILHGTTRNIARKVHYIHCCGHIFWLSTIFDIVVDIILDIILDIIFQ